jgi:hypothetical protein
MADIPEWAQSDLPEALHDIPFLKDSTGVDDFKQRLSDASQWMGRSIRIPGPDAGESDWQAFDEKLGAKVPNLVRADLDTEEGREQFLRRLGKPENAEAYGADDNSKWLADVALQAGLTKQQFESLVQGVADVTATRDTEAKHQHETDIDALHKEWGYAREKKMESIIGVAKLTNAPENIVQSLEDGTATVSTLRWLEGLATQFAEANNFTQDKNDLDNITPDEARLQINELMNNPDFFAQTPIGQSLQKKMVELQRIAVK